MNKKIIAAVLVATGLSTSAFAFEQEGVKEGNSKLGVSINYYVSSYEGSENEPSTAFVFGSYSYFFTDIIEAGLGFSYMLNDDDDTSKTTSYTLSPFINLNFEMTPTTVPYIGVGLALYGSETTTTTTTTTWYGTETTKDTTTDTNTGWNVEAGLKMFVTENAAFVPALFYQDNGDFGTQKGLKVGIEVFF